MRRLAIVLALNLGLVAALVVAGLAARSLAVLAAGADCLADAAAVGVSLLAIRFGGRRAANVAALVNAGWLLVLSVAIAVTAIWHLATGPRHVEGLPVLIVSAVSAVVLTAGALILGGDSDEGDLNVRAVLLDTAADAAASAGVAVSGAIIFATGGLFWLDPATALVIALAVAYHAAKLLTRIAAALRTP